MDKGCDEFTEFQWIQEYKALIFHILSSLYRENQLIFYLVLSSVSIIILTQTSRKMLYYKDQNLTVSYVSLNSATLILLSSGYDGDRELSPILDLRFAYGTEYMVSKLEYFPGFQ